MAGRRPDGEKNSAKLNYESKDQSSADSQRLPQRGEEFGQAKLRINLSGSIKLLSYLSPFFILFFLFSLYCYVSALVKIFLYN
jgi:hypothetical protein